MLRWSLDPRSGFCRPSDIKLSMGDQKRKLELVVDVAQDPWGDAQKLLCSGLILPTAMPH
ncbi:MAG TPA: hypothetical protein EYM96_06545 [Rhodospirillales bacterium]|nr:hypothetical protein [Rhodospirillales bacterium]